MDSIESGRAKVTRPAGISPPLRESLPRPKSENRTLADAEPHDQPLEARLAAVKRELVEATDDFARLRIRDESRAVTAAAAVLRRRDIEVEASMLYCDAEREIVRHHPPLSSGQGSAMRDNPTSDLAQRRKALFALLGLDGAAQLRKLRRAHAHFDDSEYERIKADHRARNEPLFRTTLLRYASDHSTSRRPKETDRKDRDIKMHVTITAAEHKRLRAVADRHGWSDTQALREAIRRLVEEDSSGSGQRRRAPAQKPKKDPSTRMTAATRSERRRSATSKPAKDIRPGGDASEASPSPPPARRESRPSGQGERIRLRPVIPSDLGGGFYDERTD